MQEFTTLEIPMFATTIHKSLRKATRILYSDRFEKLVIEELIWGGKAAIDGFLCGHLRPA
jgi:hypothetical protein